MVEACKKFIVLGTPRTGSESFVRALHRVPGLSTPANSTDLKQSELLNPRFISNFISIYSLKLGIQLLTQSELINAFYSVNSSSPYAGFKTFYSHVQDFGALTLQRDIQFIVLMRQDVASTMASLMVALDRGCWGRCGESHKSAWRFSVDRIPQLQKMVEAHHKAMSALIEVHNAVVVRYEDLCSNGFSDSRLDSFFGQEIAFVDPKPPVSGASYVVNWDDFRSHVAEFWPGGII